MDETGALGFLGFKAAVDETGGDSLVAQKTEGGQTGERGQAREAGFGKNGAHPGLGEKQEGGWAGGLGSEGFGHWRGGSDWGRVEFFQGNRSSYFSGTRLGDKACRNSTVRKTGPRQEKCAAM